MLLPNFTYAEFLKMVQHMEVRQRILLSGKFNLKRERDSNVGYIMDYDAKALSVEDQHFAAGRVDDSDLDKLAELAFREAAQIRKDILHIAAPVLSAGKPLELAPLGCSLRKKKVTAADDVDSDLESDLEDESDIEEDIDCDSDADEEANTPPPRRFLIRDHCKRHSRHWASNPVLSKIPDGQGKISIKLMVDYKKALQAGTTTHSERVVSLNPKFTLAQVTREADTEGQAPKMSIKEASHRLRIAQDGDSTFREARKTRELRWQTAATKLKDLVRSTGKYQISCMTANI
ncbi:hypothetical protein B0H11DRAFT_2244071 [Mycena galericulata]|nr:hypothetical protein B0H11DRAFT_2244071 [Mycena galericulata]